MISDDDLVQKKRDEALRRALNTPPKHHKNMKKGKRKEKPEARLDEPPTASDAAKRSER